MAPSSNRRGNEPITETYLPAIRPLLDNVQNLRRLQLDCGICRQRMSPDPLMLDDDICTGVAVLCCGHMVGFECLETWLSQASNRCPCCNNQAVHPGCGHLASLRRFYDPNTALMGLGAATSVPSTVPEGGVLSDECIFCALDDVILQLAELFGSDLSAQAHAAIGGYFCIQARCLTEGRRYNRFFAWDAEAREAYEVESEEVDEPAHVLRLSEKVREHLDSVVDDRLDGREGQWETEGLRLDIGLVVSVEDLDQETSEELGIEDHSGWPLPDENGVYFSADDV